MPWRKVVLRGQTVLARCRPDGSFLSDGGRVEIRYRPQDARAYRAAERNLVLPADATLLPDEHCVPAEAAAAPSKGPRKTDRAGAASAAAEAAAGAKVVAYTDGACSGNPGPAGLGVVLIEEGRRRELSEYLGRATNNIAELTAVLRALEATDPTAGPLVVHTDSQYVIGVLQKNWKPKVNQALIAELRARMKAFKGLRLVYVPGHSGVPLNERADALARRAVERRSSGSWSEVTT